MGADAYTNVLDGLHVINNCACFGLPVSDRSGAVTEREGGGSGRSIRRNGLADGVWPTRIGYIAVEGDDGVGDSVHADLAIAFDHGDAAERNKRHDSRQASGSGVDDEAGAGNTDADTAHGDTGGAGNAGAARTAVGDAVGSQDGREKDDTSGHHAGPGRAAATAAAGEEVAAGRIGGQAEMAELADALA